MAIAHDDVLANLKAGETAFRAESNDFRLEVVKVGDGFSVCMNQAGKEVRKTVSEKKARSIVGKKRGTHFDLSQVEINFLWEPYIVPSEAH